MTNDLGQWWPQFEGLRQIAESNKYEFGCRFGTIGFHRIDVVRATELGIGLVNYYRKIISITGRQREKLNSIGLSEEKLKDLRLWWPGIELTRLPRGLDSQASITVEVVPKPK